MRTASLFVMAVPTGAAFGALTSSVNAVSSPYSSLGPSLQGTGWAWLASMASLVLDAGWAWAALAVLAGWAGRRPLRAAGAGVVVLMAASAAYYVADSVLRHEPIGSYAGELVVWWAASVVLGGPLGVVGALTRRPGVVELLAGLVVPVGAAAQMLLLEPVPSEQVLRPGALGARVVVWVVAAGLGAGVVVRFARRRATAGAPTAGGQAGVTQTLVGASDMQESSDDLQAH